jgi:DMSO/TMAO reductase YedYZ molybdopterin-dependent catalytic subunit
MFGVRALFGIRTLPERVLEWTLLFVSPEMLESMLGRFGTQAKVYGLVGAVAGMVAILTVLGTLLLRHTRSPAWIVASGLLLYLAAMAGIMPLTGAGPFAIRLSGDPWLANVCYLAIGLAFGTFLLAARMRWRQPGPATDLVPARTSASAATAAKLPSSVAGRRALLGSAIATTVAFALAGWRGQAGGSRGADLPLTRVDALPRRPSDPAGTASGANVSSALPGPATDTSTKQAPRGEGGALTGAGREPGALADLISPTERFYKVTKNPVSDPVLQPDRWRLVVDGDVRSPVQLDYRTLLAAPSLEVVKTLECISNFTAQCELPPYGCELISTAAWRGVRLSDLFELAGGLNPGVTQVSLVAEDEYTSTLPIDVALDPDTILAYEMNGQPLSHAHGYPARVLASGRYGYKCAKWVVGVRLVVGEMLDWYGQRNWNKEGVVKTMTRIDVPAPGARLPAGRHRVAGIAYAGDRGVASVEISTDNGQSWRPTVFLEPAPGKDAWVRWEGVVELSAGGDIRVFARALDGTGQYQPSDFTLPAPNGASGLNSIRITGT